MEPFVVKQYSEDERPMIKGNGFDGLEIGQDREEAERFVAFVNAAVAAERERMQATPRWIPVAERLPEKFTEVLVAFAGQVTLASTGQWTGSAHDHNGWCYPAENNGICDDGSDPVVTHWMPLPDVPQAG